MSRRTDLLARRAVLLLRCDQQRSELSRQLAGLRSGGLLGLPSFGSRTAGTAGGAAHHPIAWLIAIAGLLLLGRTREVLRILVWARTALGVASRVAQVARFLVSLRPARMRGGRAQVPAQPARGSAPPVRSAS